MLIAHLSDPHLGPAGTLYQGLVDANAMFDLALDTLLALPTPPDLVLIGGDLVEDGEAASYATMRRALARLPCPVRAIPGNHDARAPMRDGLGDMLDIPPDASSVGPPGAPLVGPLHFDTRDLWPLRVIGLDVTVPGAHHGSFGPQTQVWLEDRLAELPGHPVMLLMHQPPVDSGMAFIDAYNCRGGTALAALVAAHPRVERVLCGHIHRFMQMRFGGSLLMTAPSTATAIALGFGAEAPPVSVVEPPAFLLHHWQPGRPLATHWVPVGRFPGPLPFF